MAAILNVVDVHYFLRFSFKSFHWLMRYYANSPKKNSKTGKPSFRNTAISFECSMHPPMSDRFCKYMHFTQSNRKLNSMKPFMSFMVFTQPQFYDFYEWEDVANL